MKKQRGDFFCFICGSKKVCDHRSRVDALLSDHDDGVSPWRILRIMSEFVTGFEFLQKYKNAITFFGSARQGFHKNIYREATHLAKRLSKDGYTIITGGGPGIMEAANKGAYQGGGSSVGINIKLAHEQRVNRYVKEAESFKYFFTRKVMLSFSSRAYVFFPGGFGTLDEFFEMVTLVQTKRIDPIPIILVDKEYWEPLLAWIDACLYKKNNAIKKEDMQIYHLARDGDEAFALLRKMVKKE